MISLVGNRFEGVSLIVLTVGIPHSVEFRSGTKVILSVQSPLEWSNIPIRLLEKLEWD